MSAETLNLTPKLYAYLQKISLRESPALKALREKTHTLPNKEMQISPEQGQLMALLVELLGAKRTLDIGTFTGYSALVVAQALPDDGKVLSFDIDMKNPQIAQQFWQQAGLSHKIELIIGPALLSLAQLIDKGLEDTFDFAFIDADKKNYLKYYEFALRLVRRGGLIALDNVLWGGSVVDDHDQSETTNMFRTLNLQLLQDERVSLSMIPIGDGLTLARKR